MPHMRGSRTADGETARVRTARVRIARAAAGAAFVTLVIAGACAAGCEEPPKPGGKCNLTDEKKLVACHGAGAALLCRNLRLSEVPCRGPKGCSGAAPYCD